MNFWLATFTDAVLIGTCIGYLDLIQGFMGRYYYGFFAVMMCGAYATFLFPSGHPVLALVYLLTLVVFAATTYFALARLEPQLFALFSLAQLMFVQCLTQELRARTGGESGLDLPNAFLRIGPASRSIITLCICAILIYCSYKLHNSHLAKVLTAFGDQTDFLQFFRSAFRNSIVAVTVLTAVAAAILGILLAFSFTRVDPKQYSIDEAFNISVLLIIGGRASILGAVAAPAIIWLMRATIEQQFDQPLYFGLLLQLLMVAFLIYRPNGLWGVAFNERH